MQYLFSPLSDILDVWITSDIPQMAFAVGSIFRRTAHARQIKRKRKFVFVSCFRRVEYVDILIGAVYRHICFSVR